MPRDRRYGREKGRRSWRGKGGRGEEDEQDDGETQQGQRREDMPQPGGAKGKIHGPVNGIQGKDRDEHSGGAKTEGDAISQSTSRAKKKAAAAVKAARQERFKDVPKFKLDLRKKKDLEKDRQLKDLEKDRQLKDLEKDRQLKDMKIRIQLFVGQRNLRNVDVQATECEKVSITPPGPPDSAKSGDAAAEKDDITADDITYQILVFKTKKGVLEVLIRETDGYVIAIRPRSNDKNQNHGWYYYCDVKLPARLFGVKNWAMSYNSGYMYQDDVEMGRKTLKKLVEELVGISAANCKRKYFRRGRMLQTLNVFAGETQRLSVILRFFLVNLEAEIWEPLGDLSFWTNHWAKLGNAIMRVVLAWLARIMLEEDAAKIEAEKHMAKANTSLEGFKNVEKNRNISLTQDDLLAKTPAKIAHMAPQFLKDSRMHREFVAGTIAKTPVFGANGPSNELCLPLLVSYILLIKYERKLVPELILRKEEYAKFLEENKEKKKKKKKGTTDEQKNEEAADGQKEAADEQKEEEAADEQKEETSDKEKEEPKHEKEEHADEETRDHGAAENPSSAEAATGSKDSEVPAKVDEKNEDADDDWEAIADRGDETPVHPLDQEARVSSSEKSSTPSSEKSSSSLSSGPKWRGRGSFLYEKSVLYSDQSGPERDLDDKESSDPRGGSKGHTDEQENKAGAKRFGTRHVLVLYDFPSSTRTTDLERIFEKLGDHGVAIRWVNDSIALAVFRSPSSANEAQACVPPRYKVRPLKDDDDLLAKIDGTDLEPPTPRPKTSARTAQRLIAHGMGLKQFTNVSAGERKEQEEARRSWITARQAARDDAWGSD